METAHPEHYDTALRERRLELTLESRDVELIDAVLALPGGRRGLPSAAKHSYTHKQDKRALALYEAGLPTRWHGSRTICREPRLIKVL